MVCFLIVTLAAKVFNVLTDILSEVDDLVEANEGEHAAMECTAESFSAFVPSTHTNLHLFKTINMTNISSCNDALRAPP